jgi:putative DNA modification/repair radical SAM protein
MDIAEKIAILADAAKYDASCSTAGSARANTKDGIGNGVAAGVCHSFSADGRCVALLKVLLSNVCVYDCAYCANRRSADIRRASFERDELVGLIMDFYKRNYIEGAFLSSGVAGSPDATMERLIAVARALRTRERFNGYLHMKAIPGASDELVREAARWADRVSVNIEMPSAASLARVAPDKTPQSIFGPMRTLARASGFEPRRLAAPPSSLLTAPASLPGAPLLLDAANSRPAAAVWPGLPAVQPQNAEPRPLEPIQARIDVRAARQDRRRDPTAAILPAGQTTQMVIGASPESDAAILGLAENLYLAYDVRRVYYSAFVPVGPDSRLPTLGAPPLWREHRLYQADWLFRFYGFTAAEVFDDGSPFLDPVLDPKCAWAVRHPQFFPIDINSCSYNDLLRVPGIGPRSASRVLRARRTASLSPTDLAGLGVVMKRARYFVSCSGRMADPAPAAGRLLERPDSRELRSILADGGPPGRRPVQFEFDWRNAG